MEPRPASRRARAGRGAKAHDGLSTARTSEPQISTRSRTRACCAGPVPATGRHASAVNVAQAAQACALAPLHAPKPADMAQAQAKGSAAAAADRVIGIPPCASRSPAHATPQATAASGMPMTRTRDAWTRRWAWGRLLNGPGTPFRTLWVSVITAARAADVSRTPPNHDDSGLAPLGIDRRRERATATTAAVPMRKASGGNQAQAIWTAAGRLVGMAATPRLWRGGRTHFRGSGRASRRATS